MATAYAAIQRELAEVSIAVNLVGKQPQDYDNASKTTQQHNHHNTTKKVTSRDAH